MINSPSGQGGAPWVFVALFCALAWGSGVLFGWAIRELPSVFSNTKAPGSGKRRRRKRGSYYFAEDQRSSTPKPWGSWMAWTSAVVISLALTVSAVVTLESKKPSSNGSIRRHN